MDMTRTKVEEMVAFTACVAEQRRELGCICSGRIEPVTTAEARGVYERCRAETGSEDGHLDYLAHRLVLQRNIGLDLRILPKGTSLQDYATASDAFAAVARSWTATDQKKPAPRVLEELEPRDVEERRAFVICHGAIGKALRAGVISLDDYAAFLRDCVRRGRNADWWRKLQTAPFVKKVRMLAPAFDPAPGLGKLPRLVAPVEPEGPSKRRRRSAPAALAQPML